MRISLFAFLFLVTTVSTLSAQNTNTYFNAGFGFSSWGIPIYVGYETPITEDINLGVDASYRSKSESYGSSLGVVKWKHTVFGIGARGVYYADRILDIPSEFDVYGGLRLGFYAWSTKQTSSIDGVEYNGGELGGLGLDGFIGGRYHLNSRTAVNLELGGGNVTSGGRIGISWNL